MADHQYHQSPKGLLILELSDGTIVQYNLQGVSASVDTDHDEIVERTASGSVSVSYVNTTKTIDLQAHIRSGTVIKPGGSGEVV